MNTQSQWEQAVYQIDQMVPGHPASDIAQFLRQNWDSNDIQGSISRVVQQLGSKLEQGIDQLVQPMRQSWNSNNIRGSGDRSGQPLSQWEQGIDQLAQPRRQSWNSNNIRGSVNRGASNLRNIGARSGQPISQWDQAISQLNQIVPGYSAYELANALRQSWNPNNINMSINQAAQQLQGGVQINRRRRSSPRNY